ncbi:hypothetical protein X975_16796, partial [Stegodyphus mimosarum]
MYSLNVFLQEWTRINWMHGNFYNATNNRLESLNSKLKSVIAKFSTLQSFIDDFFKIVSTLRLERDHTAAVSSQKVCVKSFTDTSIEA